MAIENNFSRSYYPGVGVITMVLVYTRECALSSWIYSILLTLNGGSDWMRDVVDSVV